MSIIKNRKKSVTAALGAAAAAVAAPAMLFLGAGTANATGHVTNEANLLGVNVTVHSSGVNPSWGMCTYRAAPISGFGIPPWPQTFYLPKNGSETLYFPGIKLNTSWKATVSCPNGGGTFTDTGVY